ncbi:hypothetical protein [Paenibacillus sp. JJ-223]|uniref:hypothetical protein n=1 Tax=Paenibacillus sp. JJ-223 TaxID=2905647 RepID=UPI001F384480|nr:hypothetical protein [Paenibacillus sp. JJ-223]CAH1203922.1 hypothetical protein PAECIP111890_02398 [Paenibacillus sp. JJ-223]
MILIKHAPAKDQAMVLSITHAPTASAGENEILTDNNIPVVDEIPGMTPILFINLESKELYFNYIKQQTVEDTLNDLQDQQTIIKKAMDDMIIGGAL